MTSLCAATGKTLFYSNALIVGKCKKKSVGSTSMNKNLCLKTKSIEIQEREKNVTLFKGPTLCKTDFDTVSYNNLCL